MFRLRHIVLVMTAAVFIATLGVPFTSITHTSTTLLGSTPALAQQAKKKKRRSLFSILFGRKKAKKKAVSKKSKRKGRSKKSRAKKRSNTAVAVAAAKVVEKRPDAKVVLVVGDFFASGLADGLTVALAQNPNVKVVDKSKGLSGFVRTDIIDWSVDLLPLVAEHKPSYIVAMLGSNDRQLMRSNGKRLKKQTPEWLSAYTERAGNLGKSLKSTGINFAWVGLPPVRFKSMSKDFLKFNEIYGKATNTQQGRFIDIWDGFSDANGNYSRSGPDVNGQIVLLRAKDGINLTRAGKRRLAFYVEGIIQKLFGGDISGAAGLAGIGIDVEAYSVRSPQYDPAKTGKTFIVQLDDPNADGGDVLAGEVVKVSAGLAQTQIQSGTTTSKPTPDRLGRVDNFAWPRQDVLDVKPVSIAAPQPDPAGILKQSSAEPAASESSTALQ